MITPRYQFSLNGGNCGEKYEEIIKIAAHKKSGAFFKAPDEGSKNAEELRRMAVYGFS
jgi:hypothetical protein